MTKRITYKAKDGSTLAGEIAEPSSAGKAPGVVVVQEWHGVNDVMKKLVDRFADAGFLAFAPDLYHGKVANDDEHAMKLMQELDKTKAVSEIGEAAQFLKSHERGSGKVGVTGFCLGGGLSLAAAAFVPGLSAVVPFYGLPGIPMEKFRGVKVPIQAHFAQKDDWAKASSAEEIKQAVTEGGGSMELFVYDAGHAFMREGDSAKYHAPSAKLAWDRAIAFLKKHLG